MEKNIAREVDQLLAGYADRLEEERKRRQHEATELKRSRETFIAVATKVIYPVLQEFALKLTTAGHKAELRQTFTGLTEEDRPYAELWIEPIQLDPPGPDDTKLGIRFEWEGSEVEVVEQIPGVTVSHRLQPQANVSVTWVEQTMAGHLKALFGITAAQ